MLEKQSVVDWIEKLWDEMIKKLYLKSVFSFRNDNIRRRKTLNLKIEIGEHILMISNQASSKGIN